MEPPVLAAALLAAFLFAAVVGFWIFVGVLWWMTR